MSSFLGQSDIPRYLSRSITKGSNAYFAIVKINYVSQAKYRGLHITFHRTNAKTDIARTGPYIPRLYIGNTQHLQYHLRDICVTAYGTLPPGPALGARFGTSHLEGDMSPSGATINHYNDVLYIRRPIYSLNIFL